ncbi:UNVERIFIED_CONTAM: hypothetical protein Slati_2590500 [Sesamum latifolium]|uniref:Uncharacterized protein n=1 Tax=Sesamum latifolium TaxID=2727402 RepID=A0AAW2VTG9_9LAMI
MPVFPSLISGKQSNRKSVPSQWQTLSHDGTVNFGSEQDLMVTEEKEQHLSQLEPHQHGLDSENRKENDSLSHEFNPLPDNPLSDAGAQPQDDRNTFPVSQPIGSLTSGEQSIHIQEPVREPNPDSQMMHITKYQ